jgi:hypothetical protein
MPLRQTKKTVYVCFWTLICSWTSASTVALNSQLQLWVDLSLEDNDFRDSQTWSFWATPSPIGHQVLRCYEQQSLLARALSYR